MTRLHENTTAQFLVNGELSPPMQVQSGIRQGCPLAPLLFIIAVEFLTLAIQQDRQLQGLVVLGRRQVNQHRFSAFVDDSTVFLSKSGHLPHVLMLVREFGRISGLRVQPAKSQYIFLNKAIDKSVWCGIPVLRKGETVPYLGYEVGFGDLSKINWEKRLRALQRRMGTAERAATTIRDRVDLLNVIVLPAILFTAKMFPPSPAVLTQLVNMQKQFLWRRQLKDDPSRHKFSPSLIFTPKKAGGLGLIAIPVAIQAQRVKTTMLWLLERQDIYHDAWRSWMGLSGDEPAVTPDQQRSEVAHDYGPADENKYN
ncbi:hypothetical protein PR001_g10729 [Phytophthora rubi]|uniref:Reverse transcriptase domain-containing protein n=1 Tax=Phytophthora rubi TaxID=129364 RepID=A0A6A3MMH8_9STRA|nr:hypothetical protein PR001_g10729 [Phytophthora rubi]